MVRNIAVSRASVAVRLNDSVTDVEASAVGPRWTSSRVNWAWYVSAVLDLGGRAGRIGRARSAGNVRIFNTLLSNDGFHVSPVAFVAASGRIAGLDAVSNLNSASNRFKVANVEVVVLLSKDLKTALGDGECLSTVRLPLNVRRRFTDWLEGTSVS